jgi:hypothetical protein
MEVIRSSYRILFGFELELVGMNDDLNQYLKLLPDQKTKDLFITYNILPRKQKNSNVSLIEVLADGVDKGRPMIMLKDNEVFRFQVKLAENNFIRRTHLASYDFLNEVLYLSNTIDHVEGTEILLSLSVENYNAANTYKSGYIVRSGSAYYKALLKSNNGNQHGVSDSAYWKSISNGTFVSHADLRTRASLTDSVDLDTIMVIEIRHNVTLNANYQLLDGSSKCREVSYKIKLQSSN